MFTRRNERAADPATYRATRGDTTLAEWNRAVPLAGDAYFPPRGRPVGAPPSTKTTVWPSKGEASSFDAREGDRVLPAAAWTHETPSRAAHAHREGTRGNRRTARGRAAPAATIAVVAELPLETPWHAVPSFPTLSEVWLRLLETYRDDHDATFR